MGDDDAEARRRARSTWQVQVFRSHEEAAEANRLYWLSIPEADRAGFVWQLSQQLFGTAQAQGVRDRRRLRRSTVSAIRRRG